MVLEAGLGVCTDIWDPGLDLMPVDCIDASSDVALSGTSMACHRGADDGTWPPISCNHLDRSTEFIDDSSATELIGICTACPRSTDSAALVFEADPGVVSRLLASISCRLLTSMTRAI